MTGIPPGELILYYSDVPADLGPTSSCLRRRRGHGLCRRSARKKYPELYKHGAVLPSRRLLIFSMRTFHRAGD